MVGDGDHISMKIRNITFRLPADLVREAKIYAAELDTTVNALVRELLQETINRGGRVPAAADRLLALVIAVRISPPTRAVSRAKNCMNGAKAFFDTNVLLRIYRRPTPAACYQHTESSACHRPAVTHDLGHSG